LLQEVFIGGRGVMGLDAYFTWATVVQKAVKNVVQTVCIGGGGIVWDGSSGLEVVTRLGRPGAGRLRAPSLLYGCAPTSFSGFTEIFLDTDDKSKRRRAKATQGRGILPQPIKRQIMARPTKGRAIQAIRIARTR
jgi:hypothetical protein